MRTARNTGIACSLTSVKMPNSLGLQVSNNQPLKNPTAHEHHLCEACEDPQVPFPTQGALRHPSRLRAATEIGQKILY